ncbi:ARM repeat-containing protein [Basidiobolus meristosporus CBS 931.73]|uniref:ARM repeat-containing protein n=1 Tax=Basidiobolus meristosporus CBS 931.73 TaxID=1314790 RepID=A0A1Y1Z540_9FUNG|nr:ARM repeat-containing protein [Basidiobolus meristosporus CBS 931.73]|eukprot:ORY05326.1 ARM repeat-containing protein [Basidiobolus meristosporus CBS 931.73]
MSTPKEQLLTALSEIASQEPERLKPAEAQLKQWETSPDFHAILQDIFYDKSLDLSIRWLSIIYLKNGIDRYWRKTAKNAISPEEKKRIRDRILLSFDEPHKQLATQSAVLTSKIARFDVPDEWPELLRTLLRIIQESTSIVENPLSRVVQQNALYTLHLVVKALCSRTLSKSRRMLESHTDTLFALAAANTANPQDLINVLEHSLISLKCLRRLVVHGFKDINALEETKESTQIYISKLKHKLIFLCGTHLGNTAYAHGPESQLLTLLSSHVTLVGKVYLDIQKFHPVSFVLADGFVEVIKYYWDILLSEGARVSNLQHVVATSTKHWPLEPSQPPPFEKFLIQGLLLIKNIVKNIAYSSHGGTQDSEVTRVRAVLDNNVLTPTFVTRFAEILITNYILLKKEDLEMWDTEPEEWLAEEEADHWEYHLRACAEKVFMDLFSQYRQILTPVLLNSLGSVSDGSIDDMNSLLLKDAVYCSIGLAAHDLYDALDFDRWLIERLSGEISMLGSDNLKAYQFSSSFKIIRRRIAWLIGKWIGIKVSKESRIEVYKMLLNLMVSEEDLVSITKMLGSVEEFDSRMRVLNTLAMIVERMEKQILPFAQRVMDLLPPLWFGSQDENLFKSSILLTVTKLVGALGEASTNMHNFVVPLVQHSIDLNHPAHVYLLEDGLDLWHIAVQNSTQCSQELYSIFPNAVNLLEYGSESLRKVLKIVESYLLLAPDMILQNFSNPIMEAFTRLLGDLKPEACRVVTHVIETIVQLNRMNLCGESMISSGLLWKLMTAILENKEYAYVLVNYLCTFARVALVDPELFVKFVRMAGERCNPPQPDLLGVFLDQWIDKFDNMGHPKQRKLNALAFITLAAFDIPELNQRFPQLVGIWTDVLTEVKESGDGDSSIYWDENAEYEEDSEGNPESNRRRELLQHDPVYSTNLIHYTQIKLKESENAHGGPQMFQQQVLSQVDPLLLEELQRLLSP